MNETIGYNVHNSAAYAPATMAYFERHHLLDIYRELFVVLARDRPERVREYVAHALPAIGERFATTRTTVLAPPIFNARTMSLKYGRMFKTPIVQYTRKRQAGDVAQVLRKFRRFVRYHRIEDKHLITFNFPGDRGEIIQCIDTQFTPTNVVEIIPGPQVPFKTREQCAAEQRSYIADFQQVKQYFPQRSVDLRFEADPMGRRPPVATSLSDVCVHLQRIVRQPIGRLGDHRYDGLPLPGRWYPRVVLIGRRGSGRKTQAALLAHELNVVFIDVEFLILKKIQSDEAIREVLASREKFHNRCGSPFVASLVQKRIMKPDCLHNGYVLVGFGTCLEDLRLMDESFAVRPNRIIFLHCRERVCQRRLDKQIEQQEKLANNVEYTRETFANPRRGRHKCAGIHLMMEPAEAYRCIEKEHILYNLNIREMVEYEGWRREVRHVDGTHSVRTVHQALLAAADRGQLEVRGE